MSRGHLPERVEVAADARQDLGADAGALRDQAKLEYATAMERGYERAVAQAGSSRAIRVALGLPDSSRSGRYVRPVSADLTSGVTVVLKDGERIAGTKLEEGKDWTIVHTEGGKVRIRPAEVMRVYEGKSAGAVKPAVDE